MNTSHVEPTRVTDESAWPAPVRAPRIFLLAVPVAIIVALAISAQTYLSMLGHGHQFAAILAWQLSSWTFWAIAAPFVLRAGGEIAGGVRRRRHVWLRLSTLTVTLVSLHIALASWLTLWFQPYLPVIASGYGQALVTQLASQLPVDLLACATLLLVGWALSVYYRTRWLELRESQLEADLARARLDTLRLEIQPHFLFNTLNAISALIRLNSNDRALEMLVGLSELMRRTLDRTGEQTVTLDAEIDFVRRYVDLQQARFGDRLDVRYEIAGDCRALPVPTFVLQPLVENALRHGMGRQSQPCRIDVGARLEENAQLHLWVSDDGVGLAPGFNIERDGRTGLSNTRSRLQRLYGPLASLKISARSGGGTCADIRIPSDTAGAAGIRG